MKFSEVLEQPIATLTLDLKMAGVESDEHFFEGTEKLLEVWFESTDGNCDFDLRKIERQLFLHTLFDVMTLN